MSFRVEYNRVSRRWMVIDRAAGEEIVETYRTEAEARLRAEEEQRRAAAQPAKPAPKPTGRPSR